MTQLATQYGRYGYRRITALMVREGWRVNHKRIERLWRREGLKVPKKQPKRGRLWLNDGSCVRLRPERTDHVWVTSCTNEPTTAERFVSDETSTPGSAFDSSRRTRFRRTATDRLATPPRRPDRAADGEILHLTEAQSLVQRWRRVQPGAASLVGLSATRTGSDVVDSRTWGRSRVALRTCGSTASSTRRAPCRTTERACASSARPADRETRALLLERHPDQVDRGVAGVP